MKLFGRVVGRRWYSRPIPGFWQFRQEFRKYFWAFLKHDFVGNEKYLKKQTQILEFRCFFSPFFLLKIHKLFKRALELSALYFGYRVLTRVYDSPQFLDGRIKNKFEPWIHENIGALFDKTICSFEDFCEWMTENSHLSLFLLILNAEFEDKFKELGNQYPSVQNYVDVFYAAIRTQTM